MAYKTANRTELEELAQKLVGPTLERIRQEHNLLKAQQMRFEIAIKRLNARQGQIVSLIEETNIKMEKTLEQVLKRAAELEDKL